MYYCRYEGGKDGIVEASIISEHAEQATIDFAKVICKKLDIDIQDIRSDCVMMAGTDRYMRPVEERPDESFNKVGAGSDSEESEE